MLPLFHVHGLANGVCGWLASGCRVRLVERFQYQRAAEVFEEHYTGSGARGASDVEPLEEYLSEQMPARVRPPGEVSSYSN